MGASKGIATEKAKRLWEERYGRALSDQELRDIHENMVAFANLLIEWYLSDRKSCVHSSEVTSSSRDAPPSRRE